MGSLDAAGIVTAFNTCFALPAKSACRMASGGDEPLYQPASARQRESYVFYARDLAQSCLHEAAHWLYAGKERRLLTDYGYWYIPDGRNEEQQRIFEQHEIGIQAREWILSCAAGTHFRVSADNLLLSEPSQAFMAAIVHAAQALTTEDWSQRMQLFCERLCEQSGNDSESLRSSDTYTLEKLG